jgi:hypothetical protein
MTTSVKPVTLPAHLTSISVPVHTSVNPVLHHAPAHSAHPATVHVSLVGTAVHHDPIAHAIHSGS